MRERLVPLDGRNVPYLYGVDCDRELAEALAAQVDPAGSLVFVVDRKVTTHATRIITHLTPGVPVVRYVVDAGEPHKTLSLVEGIVERAIGRGATRSAVVVGMGGGMVGNVAGLAAALLYRGVRLVHLPTTPVAAFDSVLSVKQAVNLQSGKNLCGTYHAPTLIACDFRWLTTVPSGELFTGLAEMAKNVLAVLPEREETLERALRGLAGEPVSALLDLWDIGQAAKAPYLRRDPRERKEALVFEYGHTMGHALEFASKGAMNHGEAVAWGMLVAAEVSHRLGHLSSGDLDRHYRVIDWLDLPPPDTRLAGLDRGELRMLLATDNKRGYIRCGPEEVAMVLLASLGRPVAGTGGHPLVPVPADLVLSALETVTSAAARPPVSPLASAS